MFGLFKNVIINFHKITNRLWFENTLINLKKYYTIVPIHEIESYFYNRQKHLHNVCHITFDDGDVTFYEIIYPLLKRYDIPVSLFVSPYVISTGANYWFQEIKGYDHNDLLKISKRYITDGRSFIEKMPLNDFFKMMPIDKIHQIIKAYQNETGTPVKRSFNMTTEQLLEVHKSGLVEVGAHTLTHPILANETETKTREEIERSVQQLSKIIGKKVIYFSYPNGIPGYDFTVREMNILKNIGIRLAFSMQKDNFSRKYHPLSIPRTGISYGNRIFMVSKLLLGKKWSKLKTGLGKYTYKKNRELFNKIG